MGERFLVAQTLIAVLLRFPLSDNHSHARDHTLAAEPVCFL
jgi:hypothetical protein